MKMELGIEVHCIRCNRKITQYSKDYNTVPPECHICLKEEAEEKKREHLHALSCLLLVERIAKIEEYIYDCEIRSKSNVRMNDIFDPHAVIGGKYED